MAKKKYKAAAIVAALMLTALTTNFTSICLEKIALSFLKSVGFPDSKLELSFDLPFSLNIKNFELGKDNFFKAEKILLSFSLNSLTKKSFSTIFIESPVFNLKLDKKSNQQKSFNIPKQLPFEKLEIKNAEITIITPNISTQANFDSLVKDEIMIDFKNIFSSIEINENVNLIIENKVSFPKLLIKRFLSPNPEFLFSSNSLNISLPKQKVSFENTKLETKPCERKTLKNNLCGTIKTNINHNLQKNLLNPIPFLSSFSFSDDKIDINGILDFIKDEVGIEFSAEHNFLSNNGNGLVRLKPFIVDKNINTIFPSIKNHIIFKNTNFMAAAQIFWKNQDIDASGDVILQNISANIKSKEFPLKTEIAQIVSSFKIDKNNDSFNSSGKLLIENASIENASIKLLNINTVLEAENLLPFKLAKNQVLSVAMANVGIPLTNGILNFSIEDKNIFNAHNINFSWGGGTIGASNVLLDTKKNHAKATLIADNIELSKVARIFDIEGLEISGLMKGKIPLTINNGIPKVNKAEIKTIKKGVLKYKPTSNRLGEGFSAKMLLQALSDFKYDEISIKTSPINTSEMEAKVTLKGLNPSFYNGYPINFELNLKGELEAIIQKSLDTYEVPNVIKEKVNNFSNH